MRKSLFIIVVLVIASLHLYAQTHTHKGSEMCSHKKGKYEWFKRMALGPNSPVHDYDALNYEIEIDLYNNFISPYPKSFNASVIIDFEARNQIDILKLNAVESSLLIDQVSMAGVSFTHQNDTLYVTLDKVYMPGEQGFVKIQYQHKNVVDNAFYVDQGFVFTDCEPQGARKWFPCWDQPSDKATFNLTAKVPADVLLGSNGRLADSTRVADTIWYNWISRDPIATYIMVMSGKVGYNLDIVYWDRPSAPGDPMPIRFYYNNGENPSYIQSIIGEMADYFSELFGEHPFEKDGFATLSSAFSWGGMENQTLTSLCPGCWYESLIAHEFAHQWFGDMITCGTWSDLWLNEGYATYLEALWIEHVAGYDAYKNEMEGNAASYLSSNPGWPIYNPEWAFDPPGNGTLFNYAITYLKSSCIHHLFRYVLDNDSLFFAFHKAYANDTINFKYKSAVTEDYIAKANEVTGEDYSWFFEQWLYQEDHPEYQNTYNFEDLGNGQWKVNFMASQVQTSTGFFKMPIELRIVFYGGSDTIVRVMNDINHQVFGFHFDKEPAILWFDPNDDIILKEASTVVGLPEKNREQPIEVFQNIPNPFSNKTLVPFYLNSPKKVSLTVFDVSGKVVKKVLNMAYSAGENQFIIRTENLEPGIYYYRVESDGYTSTQKMILSR